MKEILLGWVEALPDPAWMVDPHTLRIIVANHATQSLLGMEPAELENRPVIELMAAPEDMYFWEDVAAGAALNIHSHSLVRSMQGRSIAVDRKVSRVWLDTQTPLFLVVLRDLTAQFAHEAQLEDQMADLRATLESSHDALLVTKLDGKVLHFNTRFVQMWALPSEALDGGAAGVASHMALCVADAPSYEQRLAQIAQEPELPAHDVLLLSDGRILERHAEPRFSRGRVLGRVFSFRDVSQQVLAEKQLQLAAEVFAHSPDAIFITDADFRIVQANPVCARLCEATQAELVGTCATDWFMEPGGAEYFGKVRDALLQGQSWSGALVRTNCHGRARQLQVSWVALADGDGAIVHSVGFVQDLTEQVAAQKRIETLAHTDVLTGLPNRLVLTQRAELLLVMSQRQGTPCGVLFVDLDRFKNINESFGHSIGDKVLVEVAQRIRTCLREVDTLSRLGADEFVVFLQEADAFGAEIAARRIICELNKPFVVQEMDFSLGCSIGIALYPEDGHTVDELIQCADTAMQGVKDRGRGSLRFYQPQMNVDSLSRIKMEHAMRQGLERGAFNLVYQPQISLETGALIGAEALLRWKDAELGNVPPSTFIPLAEESGFIITLGNWVLGEAVRQATLWQKQGMPVVVSVNVSALQFQQADFVDRVADSMRGIGLDPALLELELTESILVTDADEALAKLDALAALGISLAIDDFGTGYSSLAYLKKFPISKLKIDRAFVMGLPEDESDRAIVSATVGMARALKLRVVAEGVETPAQRAYLQELQCAAFQGYLCSPGLGAAEFEERMPVWASN